MKSLDEFMQSARLPVMPEVAVKLIDTFASETVEITYMRDVIAKDPALTASVLRLANSPFYGLSRAVHSLDAAISILGISKVRTQAIAICLSNAIALPPGMSRETFWSQSLKCAGYSMWLALAVGLDESEAWLTGILLRLGEVLVAQLKAALPADGEPLGFADGQLMAHAATLWYFPQDIVNALQHCSNPLGAPKFAPLAAVLHLAAILAQREPADDRILQCLPADVVSRLGIDIEWMAQYLPDPDSFTDTSML